MFFLRKPNATQIARFLERQRESPLSFDADLTAPRFSTDRHKVVIGRGARDFAAAKAALYAWRMFPPVWTKVHPGSVAALGLTVAVEIHHLGFWSLNGTRVTRQVNEESRAGFVYTTLVDHGECGEELFAVEIMPTGDVVYEIVAISRPAHALAWLGYPYTRAIQARFRKDSEEAMRLAIAS